MNSKGSITKNLLLVLVFVAVGAAAWYFISSANKSKKPTKLLEITGEPSRTENITHSGLAFKLAYYEPTELCEYTKAVVIKGSEKVELEDRCGRVPEQRLNVMFQSKYSNLVKLGPSGNSLYILLLDEPMQNNFRTTLINATGELKLAETIDAAGQFQDYNGDGDLDLLVIGGDAKIEDVEPNYDPYLVYIQKNTSNGVEFHLDEKLSEKYSAENNYPWQGPTRLQAEPEMLEEPEDDEEETEE